MSYALKIGILVAVVIGFTVGFIGPDNGIFKFSFATGCEGTGCKHGDPVRTAAILGAAVVALGFLALKPTLKKLMAALVVIAIGIGFFAYTKPGARVLKSLRQTTACASSNAC
jgi:hypothetical protein